MSLPNIEIAKSLIISLEDGKEEIIEGNFGKSKCRIYQVKLNFNGTIITVGEIFCADLPIFNESCFFGTLYDKYGSKGDSFTLESQDLGSAVLDLLEDKFLSN